MLKNLLNHVSKLFGKDDIDNDDIHTYEVKVVNISNEEAFKDSVFEVFDIGDNNYRITFTSKEDNLPHSPRTMARVKGKSIAIYVAQIKAVLSLIREIADGKYNDDIIAKATTLKNAIESGLNVDKIYAQQEKENLNMDHK